MADSFEFKIEGLDSLLGKLESIKYETKFKGGRLALRRAAQVIRDAAIQNAARIDDPETKQSIEKNIGLRWNGKRFKRTGDIGFRVGVIGGARIPKSRPKGSEEGGPGGDTRYWAFVEFGHEKARAQPFMRPALEQNTVAATDEFVKQYEKAIDRAIKRAKKKGVVV